MLLVFKYYTSSNYWLWLEGAIDMRPRKTTKCSLASVVIQSAGRTPFVSLIFHEITLKYLQQINHNLHQQYTTALGTQSNKLHSKIQSYKRGNSNHYAQMWGGLTFLRWKFKLSKCIILQIHQNSLNQSWCLAWNEIIGNFNLMYSCLKTSLEIHNN